MTEKISINLNKIVSDISEENILERVLREAITNSIHARATNIECRIKTSKTLIANIDEIEKILISDNGEGFTNDNIKSFKQYGSDYNTKKWGAKGTGRFCFLKISDKIKYKSLGKEIELNSDGEILTNDLENTDNTILELSNIKEKFKNYPKDNIEQSIDKVIDTILPTLILIKKEKYIPNLTIKFYENDNNLKSFSLNDIPKFNVKTIDIKSEIDKEKAYKFDILYYIGDCNKKDIKVGGYCADFIKVKKFNFKVNIPNSYIILVQSQYFNETVVDDRIDFIIKDKKIGTINQLSWCVIDKCLKKELQNIFDTSFKDLKDKNKKSFESAIDKFPFFKKNFQLIETNTIGYLDAKDYVSGSYSLLNKLENDLRELQIKSLDNNLTEKEFKEILDSSSLELAGYVVNRQIVISEMQKYINENTDDEKKIHNLLMPRGEIYSDDLNDLRNCNLWLIDDKFMSFSKALSDKSIKELKKQLGEYEKKFKGEYLEPDLVVYFNSEQLSKMVVIELKPFAINGEIDRNKINAINQISDYADIINTNFTEIKEKWYYMITTIDDNFKRQLKNAGYQKLFSIGEIYFFYNPNLQTHFYILDMQTLLNDANARNKVFMDILTKHFDNVNIEK